MRRTLGVIGAALVLMGGCTTSELDRMDMRVANMIRQQQEVSLGPEASNDPHQIASRLIPATPGKAIYDGDPRTVNPPPSELPATTNPEPRLDPATSPIELPKDVEPLVLDLEGALAYAIEHSREYRTAKEDLFLAALDLVVERRLWGPLFFHDVTAEFSGTAEAGDHDQVMTLLNELRVTQRLPYGGEASVAALVSFVNMLHNASGLSPDQSQSTELTLSLTQPLLRRFGMIAREDLIQAERDLVYATRRFERFRRQFLVDIAVDYYDLLARQGRIRNLEKQVANLERLAERFEALAEAGREPYFEAERSQQQVLFARNNLFNSEESYATALDAFKIRLGMPTSQPVKIKPSQIIVPEPLLDSTRAVTTALALRLDLQTVADQIDDAQRRMKNARNALLPDLDLFADVAVPTDADKEQAGIDLSFRDSRYTAGARFSSPLERTTERAAYREAIINFERAHRSHTLQRDRVAQEVRRALRQIQRARFTLQIQELNLKLAERRQLGVKLRERVLGPRDVIEAEDDLLEARDRQDEAVRDLRVSILQYLLATGQMRVSATGRWLPPAKLVPLPEEPPVQEADDLARLTDQKSTVVQ